MRPRPDRAACALALALALAAATLPATAALPRDVGRAFLDAGVPLTAVGVVVQDVTEGRPLFSQRPDRAYNPASVMKLVTTFAALELLGPDFQWQTTAYLDGPLDAGVLRGNLVLKGGGDPKITLERWQAFMAMLRDKGLANVRGRPRPRPELLRAPRTRCGRVRRRAAETVQRRSGRAARQLQVREVRASLPVPTPTRRSKRSSRRWAPWRSARRRSSRRGPAATGGR